MNRRTRLARTGKNAAANRARNSTFPVRSQGLRPVSARRARQNRERAAMIGTMTGGERPVCVVWIALAPAWCTRWADDAHEKLSRARRGSITLRDNVTLLCRACHDLITFRPESELGWAFRLGLIKHSGLCCRGRDVCERYAQDGAA